MQPDIKTDIRRMAVRRHIINIQQIPNCHTISSSLHIIGVMYIRTGYKMQTDTKTDILTYTPSIINIQPIPKCHAVSSLHIIGVMHIIAAILL